MAIHPTLHPQHSQGTLSSQQTRAISAWSEQAVVSLENLTISDPAATRNGNDSTRATSALRGASVSLAIPLDDEVTPQLRLPRGTATTTQKAPSVSFRRREPLTRDSLKSREALLKGKDGSRRRQRWENDRLLHNPWAEPPSPNDWLIQPTYPRHEPMPYYLAPLWDIHYAHRDHNSTKQTREEKHRIPKELRLRLKHARAARGMLQGIEDDIRQFIQKWNEKQVVLRRQESQDAPSSEEDEDSEEEIVFVGRNGQMQDAADRREKARQMRGAMSATHDERDGEKMVLESLVDDRAAGFGRWLVHSIATYYGLHTWSITVGEPARREAYVGFSSPAPGSRTGLISLPSGSTCRQEAMIRPGDELPTPLWAQV